MNIPEDLRDRVYVFAPKTKNLTTVAYFTPDGDMTSATPFGDGTSVHDVEAYRRFLCKNVKIKDQRRRLDNVVPGIEAIREAEVKAMVEAIRANRAGGLSEYYVGEWSVATKEDVRLLMERLAKYEFALHKDALAEFATKLCREEVEGVGVPCDRCGLYESGVDDFTKLVDPLSAGQAGPEKIYCWKCHHKLECTHCKQLSLEPEHSGLTPDERLAQDTFGVCVDCWDVMKELLADDTEIFALSRALLNAGLKCREETWKVPEDVVKFAKWKKDEGWSAFKSARSVLFQYATDFDNTFKKIPRWVAEAAFLVWLNRRVSGWAHVKPNFDDSYPSRLRSEADNRITRFANMMKEAMTR